jgi:hypothetical protein
MFADESLDLAWKTHRAFLVDLPFRIVGDIGVAEDVVQEAFFRLMPFNARVVDEFGTNGDTTRRRPDLSRLGYTPTFDRFCP